MGGDLAGILAIVSSDKQKPGFLSEAGPDLRQIGERLFRAAA